MKRVVLDTNILVSALWSESGNAAKIFEMVIKGEIKLCYDSRIMAEYKAVLNRPRFAFERAKIGAVINRVRNDGMAAVAKPCETVFADEDDKMFYEVAKECHATLITGNLRHYPRESFIKTAAEFLEESHR
jgi:putative PIN family toxin of toxin-antitoxin system